METETETLRVAFHILLEQTPTQLRLRIERIEIEVALQRGQVLERDREVGDVGCVRQVIPLVVIGLDPELRSELRMPRDVGVEILVEELVRALRFRGDLFGRVNLVRGKKPRKRKEEKSGEGREASRGHHPD